MWRGSLPAVLDQAVEVGGLSGRAGCQQALRAHVWPASGPRAGRQKDGSPPPLPASLDKTTFLSVGLSVCPGW